ncbi:hypothetical protein AAE478_006635, partial [Parahypoxylon ruwenzoriense]
MSARQRIGVEDGDGVRRAGNAPSQVHLPVDPAAIVYHMPLTSIEATVERVEEGVDQAS